MDYGTFQGIVAVFCGLVLFLMGYYKGMNRGSGKAIEALIEMRILKLKSDGSIVRGEMLDLE
jgi:hypothetical protein